MKTRRGSVEFSSNRLPPSGGRYACTCEHKDGRRWSIVFENIEQEKDRTIKSDVRFLVPEIAPNEMLESGNTFVIYEGAKIVGVVTME